MLVSVMWSQAIVGGKVNEVKGIDQKLLYAILKSLDFIWNQ